MAAMWLAIKPMSSGRPVSALNHFTTSSTFPLFFAMGSLSELKAQHFDDSLTGDPPLNTSIMGTDTSLHLIFL